MRTTRPNCVAWSTAADASCADCTSHQSCATSAVTTERRVARAHHHPNGVPDSEEDLHVGVCNVLWAKHCETLQVSAALGSCCKCAALRFVSHRRTRAETPPVAAHPPAAAYAARESSSPVRSRRAASPPPPSAARGAPSRACMPRHAPHHEQLCFMSECNHSRGQHTRVRDALRSAVGAQRQLPGQQLAIDGVRVHATVVRDAEQDLRRPRAHVRLDNPKTFFVRPVSSPPGRSSRRPPAVRGGPTETCQAARRRRRRFARCQSAAVAARARCQQRLQFGDAIARRCAARACPAAFLMIFRSSRTIATGPPNGAHATRDASTSTPHDSV